MGNPLEDGQKQKITEGGTKALIAHLRESMPGKLPDQTVQVRANVNRTSATERPSMAQA